MEKTFVIRIDLESYKGIKEGLPKILSLFKKHNVKGSFYVTMGGESNIFEIIRNRRKMKSSGERKIKLWSIGEKIRMLIFPIDFIKKNRLLLCKILLQKHELGIHGWKHREWTRNLENVNIEKRIKDATIKYKQSFMIEPSSWTSPGFNTNYKVMKELEKINITHVSDFRERHLKENKIKNIEINICGENKMPFIEYWAGEGKSNWEIFERFKEEVLGKKFVSFYIHGMYEGRFKIFLLEQMILYLKSKNFKSKRIIDIK